MHTIPFVGRKRELQFLHEQWQNTQRTGTRLVLVSGLAGSGKTSLLHHFLRELPEGTRRGEGRGWDNSAAVPYQALREAALQLINQDAATDLDSEYLDAFLTSRSTRHRSDAPPPELLFAELAHFFHRCANGGLCIFLDDLQWSDEGTFEWLDYALHALGNAPILWLGAYRREEEEAMRSLLTRRERFARENRLVQWDLGPLVREDVEKMARAHAASELDDATCDEVWERSEGLALLVVEELRTRDEDATFYPRGDDLIKSRLDRLDPNERETLTQAAIIGERFALKPLATALGQDETALVPLLQKLEREVALLVTDGDVYRFAHNRYREALLSGLPEDARRAYHQRLSQQVQLSASERTYHLVHSGDARLAIDALIEQGDAALHMRDWRDAMRYYVEAQWHLPDTATDAQRAAVYERLGYLQMAAAGEARVAGAYFEAALKWATTPTDRARLLCRLAEIYHAFEPDRAQRFLREASELAESQPQHPEYSWVFSYRAEIAQAWNDQQSAYELAQKALSMQQDKTAESALRAQAVLLSIAGVRRDSDAIRRYEKNSLPVEADSSWHQARSAQALASAYYIAGEFERARYCAEQGLALYKKLGRQQEIYSCWRLYAHIALTTGNYLEARAQLQQALSSAEDRPIALAQMHVDLCNTWLHDRHVDGPRWASAQLECWRDYMLGLSNDEYILSKRMHILGTSEYILRTCNAEDEFRHFLEECRRLFQQRGLRTDRIWCFADTLQLPELEGGAIDLDAWSLTPGNDEAHVRSTGGEVVLSTPRLTGFYQMDMPQLMRRVTGDFSLQATLPSGAELLSELLRCRQQAGAGHIAECATGGGGLLMRCNRRDGLRLFAHIRQPGEVLCTIRRSEQDLLLGRGLLGEGAVRLRLERRGTNVRAYAGEVGGAWYLCGKIDLPEWEAVDVGLYAECPVDSYYIVVHTETPFRSISFENSPTRTPSLLTDSPYVLPERTADADFPEFVAAAAQSHQMLNLIRRTANTPTAVLVQGETGTGKELVARALHRFSSRNNGPFVPVNCAAIAADILARELFGHVRGAYTGAYAAHGGLFEAADGGTLFLDEIGEATPELQAALLRVLEDGSIRRVGDTRLRPVDVRIIAATNRDLAREVEAGLFRRDLYYRLSAQRIDLPPLKNRRDDIPHLACHYLQLYCQQRGGQHMAFSQRAMRALVSYDWPGNVRELINEVERTAASADGPLVDMRHLTIQVAPESENENTDKQAQQIVAALDACKGNRSAAARRLGIDRTTLYRKMRRLGIETKQRQYVD